MIAGQVIYEVGARLTKLESELETAHAEIRKFKERAAKEVSGVWSGFVSMGKSALSGAGLAAGFATFGASIKAAFAPITEGMKTEDTFARLRVSLDSIGEGSDENIRKYQAWSEEMAKTTRLSREQVADLLRQSLAIYGNSEQAARLTKTAIALSPRLGGVAEAMSELTGEIEGTRSDKLDALVPGIARLSSGSERLARIQAEVSRGMEQEGFLANTASSKFDKLVQSIQRLAADVGEKLLPTMKSVLDMARGFADSINIGKWFGSLALDAESAFNDMMAGLARFFAMFLNTFNNMVTLARNSFERIVGIWSEVVTNRLGDQIYRTMTGATQAELDAIKGLQKPRDLRSGMVDVFSLPKEMENEIRRKEQDIMKRRAGLGGKPLGQTGISGIPGQLPAPKGTAAQRKEAAATGGDDRLAYIGKFQANPIQGIEEFLNSTQQRIIESAEVNQDRRAMLEANQRTAKATQETAEALLKILSNSVNAPGLRIF